MVRIGGMILKKDSGLELPRSDFTSNFGNGVIHGVNNGAMGEYLMIATRGHLASHFWRGWPSISP